MSGNHTQACMHVDKPLRWLGVRNGQGCKVYLFQCLGCGKTFTSHTPMRKQEIRPLADLSLLTDL